MATFLFLNRLPMMQTLRKFLHLGAVCTHLNEDKIEKNLSVPEIKGRPPPRLFQDFSAQEFLSTN